MTDRELSIAIRQALLMMLDALERWMIGRGWWDGLRTAELRKLAKRGTVRET